MLKVVPKEDWPKWYKKARKAKRKIDRINERIHRMQREDYLNGVIE